MRSLALSLGLICFGGLALVSCADRALDAEGGITPTSDLAGLDLRGLDLATKPVDAGPVVVDLAVSAQVGVECGGILCKTNEICCGLSGVMGVACTLLVTGGGPNGGSCFGGGGYRCDGPEDCMNGLRCVGSDIPDPGLAPTQTRCRMNAGNNSVIVCRVNADCRMGDTCTPTMQIESGAPTLSICQ